MHNVVYTTAQEALGFAVRLVRSTQTIKSEENETNYKRQ